MKTLAFSGALDIACYPVFRDAFREHIADAQPLVIDLSEVTLVDSTFLTELLLFVRRVDRPSAPAGVVIAHPGVLRIFTIARLAGRLRIFGTVEKAMAELQDEALRSDISN